MLTRVWPKPPAEKETWYERQFEADRSLGEGRPDLKSQEGPS